MALRSWALTGALACALGLAAPSPAAAQVAFIIPDSGTGDRVMLFDADGNLTNANWITDASPLFELTTPKEAIAIGGEVWVSDQVADAVHRFGLDFVSPTYLGSITTDASGNTLDNIRGLGDDTYFNAGRTVFLTRFHGTPALRGTVVIDAPTATPTGFFPAPATSGSFFDVEPIGNGEMLVSNSATDDIERYRRSDGAFLGTFAQNLTLPQQVARMVDGSIVTVASVAAAGVEGVYHFNSDGTLRRYIDTSPLEAMFGAQTPQGAHAMSGGDYLIGASDGVFRYSVATNTFTEIIGGVSGQYVNPIWIPEPAALGTVACAGLLALRRRA
jgi:hypothetical protein